MCKLEDKELARLVDEFASVARKAILGDDPRNGRLFDKVQECGVKLFGIRDDKFDGMCFWNQETKQPEIYLNVDQPKDRRLFTLAHELGHLFLNYGWAPGKNKIDGNKKILSVSFRDKDKAKDTESVNERMANEFAGAFLMPRDMVEAVISNQPDLNAKLDSMIKCFGVTDRAAVNRLIMLGVINESGK